MNYITDYVRTRFLVSHTNLKFDIDDCTTVEAEYEVTPLDDETDLVLNGDKSLELISFKINDLDVEYSIKDSEDSEDRDLIVKAENIKLLSRSFIINVVCMIYPEANTELYGLYKSNNTYCTQCESQGFRRIVYSFDRPDVLSRYNVTIVADSVKCPVVLTNGNLVEHTQLGAKSQTVMYDPHPKPSYLFALVAGDLGHIESIHKSNLNKDVVVRIYAPSDKIKRLDHCMDSILKAMTWDEETYGLFYDLNVFNIVCLDDFNMGAMENKGLNIFNSKYVLASYDTATNTDYDLIRQVVGHEYFHNWTGNRVTLEKWFDLTLKEGLTVFRDQNFSQDTSESQDALIKRVIKLRNEQFIEDDSSNAHPIRPTSYKVMDNFYTSTVYNKGAEVVRILETALGKDGFRKGLDLYFERHDGCAVSCDDFLNAMYDANIDKNADSNLKDNVIECDFNDTTNIVVDSLSDALIAHRHWYDQLGTPNLHISYFSIKENNSNTIVFVCTQTNPKCKNYKPVLIPIKLGLLNKSGQTVYEKTFLFYESEKMFCINNIESECIPSFMRDFSAPVITTYNKSNDWFLVKNDTNIFNRWDSLQNIHKDIMIKMYTQTDVDITDYINLLESILTSDLDPSLKAVFLTLPKNDVLAQIPDHDPVRFYEKVVKIIYKKLSNKSRKYLVKRTDELINNLGFDLNNNDLIAQRRIEKSKNRKFIRTNFRSIHEEFSILIKIRLSAYHEDEEFIDKLYKLFVISNNLTLMTACIDALSTADNLTNNEPEPDTHIYKTLYKMIDIIVKIHKNDSLMISRWLGFIAKVPSIKTVHILSKLYKGKHKRSNLVSKTTPNHLHAILITFMNNPYAHYMSVSLDHKNKIKAPGYKFLSDCLLDIDSQNSFVSSRIAVFFKNKKIDPVHKKLLKKYLNKIKKSENLSQAVKEKLN